MGKRSIYEAILIAINPQSIRFEGFFVFGFMGECVVVIEKIKYGGGVNDKSQRKCN